MVREQTLIPRAWRARLQELADERAVARADVVRIILREALYERPLPRRGP